MASPKAPLGHFTLLYFASATSYTKKQHDFLPCPLAVNKLFETLEKLYPGMTEKVLSTSAVTVNLEYVDLDENAQDESNGLVLAEGDEVAIIPPRVDFSSQLTKTIVYKKVGNLEIPLDLYLPPNAKNAPVVIWFHGGGLLQGRRDRVPPHFINAMSKHNFAFLSPDYRLCPQVGVADVLEDVKDCVVFARSPDGLSKHAGEGVIDRSRLAVSGGSAGGYIAFLAGLYIEPKPQVIMPIYPITDPLGTFFITPQPNPWGPPVKEETVAPFMDPNAEVVANNEWDTARQQNYFWMMQECNLAKLWRVPEERGPKQDYWKISKSLRTHGLPPTYVVHGDGDRIVGIEQADEAVGAMMGEGLTIAYERIHDVDHLFDMVQGPELAGMYEFMMMHL